jgi:hypothetical protein
LYRPRDRAHACRVEERAGAEVEDEVRLLGGSRQHLLERRCACHVELPTDAHHGAVVELLGLDDEVDTIPHERRV